MGNAESIDLSKVLTPELFEALRRVHLPWAEDKPLDYYAVAKAFFAGEPDTRPEFYKLAFHKVLKPLSTLGVENVPDMMQFLPPPEAPNFPSQALGLMLLLDQVPRSIFSGVNGRYTNSYFDVIAQKLTLRLLALPAHLRPDSTERLTAQGWSLDYATAARFWFYAPLIHSENLEFHGMQLLLVDDMRRVVEKSVGRTDPARATMTDDLKDIYGFAKLLRSAPIREGIDMGDFFFWLLRLAVLHVPLIQEFGRYPYRNNSVGRVSTAAEEQYAKDTDYFAMERDEEVIKKIRADVEAGIWSPLQDEPRFSGAKDEKIVAHIWSKVIGKEE
ncbi:hypothetical protein PsYK624_091620 [Phanerochaete sordida]|uniref:Uncharacterized protein n=1 Tax=Phanerochaete sordida TaxID=48140 RepID=A0A9P3GBG3_9APHY|nr:hypothetical protein PsYK624_091620 [Phanerochaete sordida]